MSTTASINDSKRSPTIGIKDIITDKPLKNNVIGNKIKGTSNEYPNILHQLPDTNFLLSENDAKMPFF